MLKAYFDGSNKGDSTQYEVLTLAAIAATDSIWRNVESRWNATIKKHGASYLHMNEAMCLNKEFTGEMGGLKIK